MMLYHKVNRIYVLYSSAGKRSNRYSASPNPYCIHVRRDRLGESHELRRETENGVAGISTINDRHKVYVIMAEKGKMT